MSVVALRKKWRRLLLLGMRLVGATLGSLQRMSVHEKWPYLHFSVKSGFSPLTSRATYIVIVLRTTSVRVDVVTSKKKFLED